MAQEFRNCIGYLLNCMKSFEEEPFNEVDSLIFSWISYMHFPEEIIPKEEHKFHDIFEIFRAEHFEHLTRENWSPEETIRLLGAVVASPRFRGLKLGYHKSVLEHGTGKQFSAVTFKVRDDLYYVAYRGTDRTFTGWEEDFMMALNEPIPSQKIAAAYLQEIDRILQEISPVKNRKFIVGGHSKGGNLAVYASSHCGQEIQEKITAVYTHDGPGLRAEELEDEGFIAIQPRIQKTAPQFSIFGMLFEQEVEPKIISSNQTGIMQHNPISWETGEYELVTRSKSSRTAHILNQKIKNWLDSLNYEERQAFIETIFGLLEETGVTSFDELGADIPKYLPIIYHSLKNQDPETQKFMTNLIKQLVLASRYDDDEKERNVKEESDDFGEIDFEDTHESEEVHDRIWDYFKDFADNFESFAESVESFAKNIKDRF